MSDASQEQIWELPNGEILDPNKYMSSRQRMLLRYTKDGIIPTTPTDVAILNSIFGTNHEADLSSAEPASPEVPDGTVQDVINWVDGDQVRASHALIKENASDHPRSSLVTALTALVEGSSRPVGASEPEASLKAAESN